MSLCATCGLQLTGDAALCPHHHCVYGTDWAVANRIMCNFFHRKQLPPRLSAYERKDSFWSVDTSVGVAESERNLSYDRVQRTIVSRPVSSRRTYRMSAAEAKQLRLAEERSMEQIPIPTRNRKRR